MRKYYSYPLLFFFLAATLGLFLRWQFVAPTPGVRFAWFVHSHSHVMFLGWVLNVFYLSGIEYYFPPKARTVFLKLFWFLLVLVVAMMISFPLQGYGTYSIIFSTVHTLAVMAFVVFFFRRTRQQEKVSLWFARVAWLFFLLSTAGPFSLGYLMSSGLGQTVWYDFSIYFYLHFQYNGFFLFGVLSLLYQLLERNGIVFDPSRARLFGRWLAIACIPTYALSVLFARPGIAFNIIGAAGALIQLLALLRFLRDLGKMANDIRKKFSRIACRIGGFILLALVGKMVLQLFSAHPEIARMAYALRPVVIAYLHLVLVGVITFSLLIWYIERNLVGKSLSKLSLNILMAGFLGSQMCLVFLPWWSRIVGEAISPAIAILVFSVFMWLGSLIFYVSFRSKQG